MEVLSENLWGTPFNNTECECFSACVLIAACIFVSYLIQVSHLAASLCVSGVHK